MQLCEQRLANVVSRSAEDQKAVSDARELRVQLMWEQHEAQSRVAEVEQELAELRKDYNQPLVMNPDSEYKEITRRKTIVDSSDKVPMTRNMRMRLPFEHKEDYIPVEKTTIQQEQVKAATFVAPEPREVRKKALIELLADRSAQLEEQQAAIKAEARKKQALKDKKDEIMYNAKIKKAKKESSKREEFKSQRKSKKK